MLNFENSPIDRNPFQQFRKFEKQIAQKFSLGSSLKHDIALLIELYDAERAGQSLTISMLGLMSEIPQSTMLRYLRMLEKSKLVQRIPHPDDQRMSFIRLAPEVRLVLDRVFANSLSPARS